VANLSVVYPILLLLMLYDWWSTKKIQPATLWGAAFLVTMQQVVRPLASHSAPFQSFAAVPIKDEPNDHALFGEKTELPRIGKS
jgi:hypothetical protein